MSKKNIALIVAGCLMLFGIILALIGSFFGGVKSVIWRDGRIHTVNEISMTEENTMSSQLESFDSVDVSTLSANVELVKSDKNAVEYFLDASEEIISCGVENNTFVFKTKGKFVLTLFSFDTNPKYVRVYYDDTSINGSLKDVALSTAAGSVHAENLKASNVSLASASGSINASNIEAEDLRTKSTSGSSKLSNIKAQNVTINGTSSSVNLNNVESSGNIQISNVGGDIISNTVSCEGFSAKNTSGSVNVENLSSKKTDIKSASGSIKLQGELLGKTTVNSVSGSIKIYSTQNKSDCGYSLSSVSGSTKVNEEKINGTVNEDKENFIDAKTTSGSIRINFE